MPEAFKYVIDAVVAIALFLALTLVFAVDWFFFSAAGPGKNTLEGVKVTEATRGEKKKLRLAVTQTQKSFNPKTKQEELWDDMGSLLKQLGEGFKEFDLVTDQDILQKKKKLSDYDVLFLTCAAGGEQLNNELRDFVSNGGILYASDWRYNAVASAFPDMVGGRAPDAGANQQMTADVVDASLRDVIGGTIHLNFDMPEWKTAAFGGPRVKTLIKGKYKRDKSTQFAEAPLMVSFRFNKGTVMFTSFHNEKQNSRTEKELLRYLVFSLVTADIDAEIADKMDQGGFTPQRSNLLSTPPKNQSTPPKTYENPHKSTLRFVLGFRDDGTKLRFNIKSPGGQQYTWEGMSTVILEVPNAEPGPWSYTVTALELPNAEFAFRVAVGERK